LHHDPFELCERMYHHDRIVVVLELIPRVETTADGRLFYNS
jgi:hypothetical protein